MRQAGFRYEKHKKSYYVDRHEDPDVICDRKTYLQRFFESEIFEHCWVQITRRKYDTLKCQDGLTKVEVKREKGCKGGDGEDLVSKINAYIAEKFTFFTMQMLMVR